MSQLLLAGARLGVQTDFVPSEQFEPDAGPDPDLDGMRERLATLLEGVDDFTEVFDPYVDPPELVSSQLSDDLADIAASVAHGLQHYRRGSAQEALWWWQFSYVSSWGSRRSASLRALQSVIAHDRLDASEVGEVEPPASPPPKTSNPSSRSFWLVEPCLVAACSAQVLAPTTCGSSGRNLTVATGHNLRFPRVNAGGLRIDVFAVR